LSLLLAFSAWPQSDANEGETFYSVPPPYTDPGQNSYSPRSSIQRLATTYQHGGICNSDPNDPDEVAMSPKLTMAVCDDPGCRFSVIQSHMLALARKNRKACYKAIESHQGPLWKNLDQFDRFKLILKLANRHVGHYDDPRVVTPAWKQSKTAMMVCIGAAETGESLDPMTISLENCRRHPSTQAGLGGMSRQFYLKDVNSGAFQSEISRYQGANASKIKTYDILTTDPELQLEFMDYYLSSILRDRGGSVRTLPVEWLADHYNTAISSYGPRVAACHSCVLNMLQTQPASYTPSEVANCVKRAQSGYRRPRRTASGSSL
jgi:hypothetical protein